MPMPVASAFQHIQVIVDYLLKSSSRHQILAFLCENIDPFGELCSGLASHLDGDGFLQVESKYGWSTNIPDPPPIHINDDFPRSLSLRTMRTTIANIERDSKKFAATTAVELIAGEYKTSVSIPASHSVVYGFMFQTEMDKFDYFPAYIECIRSILVHWEHTNSLETRTSLARPILTGNDLTNRQELILAMIREGKTNLSIAISMGYSESLIRQETVSIYRKMGVQGRRDIMADDQRGRSAESD